MSIIIFPGSQTNMEWFVRDFFKSFNKKNKALEVLQWDYALLLTFIFF